MPIAEEEKAKCLIMKVSMSATINPLPTNPIKSGGGGVGALCVDIGFYADISKESRCNSEINVWAHFYKKKYFFNVLADPKSICFTQTISSMGEP